jgi:phenylalanyl-tRNA synthetase beta chain
MLVSVTWLQELLDRPLDAGEVASMLTSLGLEVEGITRHGEGLDGIVVGEVKSTKPHPQADRLTLVELFDGAQTLDVVCGAPNVPAPGGKVVFAPVGSVLPNGLELVERDIRGQKSQGMICAEDELGIGADHSGIVVLPDDWAAGERLVDKVPGVVDTVIEIGVTPNRPDALGHVGIARDLAVKLGETFARPEPPRPEAPTEASLVTIEAPDRCGRYYGYTLAGASIGPSPLWMRVRLHRVGLRPINNAVDVTNFVLMEYGQPLHAFDRSRLAEGRVVVRLAQDETMTTLDETEIELSGDDLVIADANAPQALAGVMGGAGSMVEESAEELLLEAAWFWPEAIRATARRHGFHTDSSHRFERGVDYGWGLEAASLRAAALLCELTGARVTGQCLAEGDVPATPDIRLRPARVGGLLGMSVPDDESARILEGLEVGLDRSDPNTWHCVPPTHRPDLGLEEDLIEEVMRHHGLDALPATPTLPSEVHVIPPDSRATLADQVTDALVETGLHELVSFAFTDPTKLERFSSEVAADRWVEVANPMRVQSSVMRTHLLPGLLDALALNASRHARDVRLFEVGRTYAWPAGGDAPHRPGASERTREIDATLPSEHLRAGIVIGSRRDDAGSAAETVRSLLHVLRRLGHDARTAAVKESDRVSYLHPGGQASFIVSNGDEPDTVVGMVGEIHPDLHDAWDLPEGLRAYYGELRLDEVDGPRIGRYAEIPRFPATSRDLSLDLAQSVAAATVIEHVQRAADATRDEGEDAPRLAPGDDSPDSVAVVEDYRGEGIADGRRALLLRLHYRATGRSVTDAGVQSLHDAIVKAACASLARIDPDVRTR